MLAGDVTAVLGARVDASGFTAYDAAIARSVAAAGRAEQASTAHERALVRSNRALAGFAKTAAVGVVGGVGLATAAIAKSVKVAANFEEQLSALKSVTGANGKVMADLKKQAMDAGAATKYSALEAAQAQTELAKGGMSVQKIMKGGLAGALGRDEGLDEADAGLRVGLHQRLDQRLCLRVAGRVRAVRLQAIEDGTDDLGFLGRHGRHPLAPRGRGPREMGSRSASDKSSNHDDGTIVTVARRGGQERKCLESFRPCA